MKKAALYLACGFLEGHRWGGPLWTGLAWGLLIAALLGWPAEPGTEVRYAEKI